MSTQHALDAAVGFVAMYVILALSWLGRRYVWARFVCVVLFVVAVLAVVSTLAASPSRYIADWDWWTVAGWVGGAWAWHETRVELLERRRP